MGNPVIGIGTKIGVKTESTPGDDAALATGASWLDTVSESLDYVPVLHRIAPLLGDRQAHADFEKVGHHDGGGSFIIRPHADYFDTIMMLILGRLSTGYKPILDNTVLPSFTLEVDKAGQNNIKLLGCKVNTATFRSQANDPLEIELDIASMSGVRDGSMATFTSAAWLSDPFYMHGGITFTTTAEAWLGGATSTPLRSVEFTLNNNLDTESYCNSTGRAVIPEGMFSLEGSIEVPYNATSKGFWAEMVAAAKVGFSIAYTDGTATMTFAFTVKLDGELPKISAAEAIWLTLNFHGVADTASAECIIATVS